MSQNQHEALKKVDELVSAAKKPVAIFDLDGTIFEVNYRHMEIFRRFVESPEIRRTYTREVEIVEKIGTQNFKYRIDDTLISNGVDPNTETGKKFIELTKEFWFGHFFTNELVAFDLPYPGAQRCVKYFLDKNVTVVYLSGRDVPNMKEGTLRSLEKHGFPTSEEHIALHLKPSFDEDDLEFKQKANEIIRKMGDVVVTFDNEPANVQLFVDAFPEAVHFHFDTLYANEKDINGKHLHIIKSFAELGFLP